MLPPKKTRDLARSLVAREGEASLRIQPTTVRAYERLRLQLSILMGVDGFHAVASRALALAKSHSPRLNAVQVTADGGLLGLDAVGGGEAGIVLIAQLLGLFLTFLGEATTLRLIEDLHLQVTAAPEPATIGADPAGLAAEGPAAAAAFSDLLLEIDRLRIAGDNIETLAAKYPGMEEGLVSLASNIQSFATVLDVFTLIKSKAGERLNDAPLPQMNGYVH